MRMRLGFKIWKEKSIKCQRRPIMVPLKLLTRLYGWQNLLSSNTATRICSSMILKKTAPRYRSAIESMPTSIYWHSLSVCMDSNTRQEHSMTLSPSRRAVPGLWRSSTSYLSCSKWCSTCHSAKWASPVSSDAWFSKVRKCCLSWEVSTDLLFQATQWPPNCKNESAQAWRPCNCGEQQCTLQFLV